jgi:hypothetical protein
MDSSAYRDSRVLWSFWVACGLAATGAIAPLVLAAGGAPSRISTEGLPFAIAAIALAANAVTYPRGRPLATALYILAWLAIVYGILRMVAIPLQELVAGGCLAANSACTPGSASFSGGEGAAIGISVVTGALALQAGFFGLRILYRGPKKAPATSVITTSPAPHVVSGPRQAEPSVAPVVAAAAVEQPVPEHPDATPLAASPQPARKPRTKRAAKPAAELSAPSEPAELPAHSELDELPAHSEPAELPPHSGSTSSS